MPSAKLALAAGLAVVSLSACGVAAKPVAGTLKAVAATHNGIDDARRNHIQCLKQDHIPVTPVTTPTGLPGLRVGATASGPTVTFEATPGVAQGRQINGQAQGAEVIGSALLYPNQASDRLLAKVESCIAVGVTG